MLRFLKNIIQLLLNPGQGWADIDQERESSAQLLSKGFYPMLAICTLSCLGMMFKVDMESSFAATFCAMLVTLTSYFVTIYISRFIFMAALPKITTKSISTTRNTAFIVYCLGIMMLIDIIVNLLPFSSVLFTFLRIYVVVIMYKADKFMGIQTAYAGHFMFLSVLSIMMPPYLIYYLFKMLIPEI